MGVVGLRVGGLHGYAEHGTGTSGAGAGASASALLLRGRDRHYT